MGKGNGNAKGRKEMCKNMGMGLKGREEWGRVGMGGYRKEMGREEGKWIKVQE